MASSRRIVTAIRRAVTTVTATAATRMRHIAAAWTLLIRSRESEAGDASQTAVITVLGIGIALAVMVAIKVWVTGNLQFPSMGGSDQ